jgi:hypothetical protein
MIILGFNILILAWANCVVAAGHYLYNKCSFYRTKWVSSYSPYQISISLKQIQEFLNMDKHMSHDLFNMGVRILATTEHQKLKSSNQKVTKHYMDLRLCVSKTFFLFAAIKLYMIYHNNVFSLSGNI